MNTVEYAPSLTWGESLWHINKVTRTNGKIVKIEKTKYSNLTELQAKQKSKELLETTNDI